jgi:uncharacterized protein YjbK
MPQNLEIEFKTLLSLPEYDRLMMRFSHISPVRQTNYYFDSKDLQLREKRLALRIRTFDKAAEMTLKVPQEIGNIEYNIDLTLECAKNLIAQKSLLDCPVDLSEVFDVLKANALDISVITCIGSLTTIRREYQIPIGKAALDTNEYLGTSDYEFELEVRDNDQGQKDFDAFLLSNDIEFRYARSKVVRFLDTKRHLKS